MKKNSRIYKDFYTAQTLCLGNKLGHTPTLSDIARYGANINQFKISKQYGKKDIRRYILIPTITKGTQDIIKDNKVYNMST